MKDRFDCLWCWTCVHTVSPDGNDASGGNQKEETDEGSGRGLEQNMGTNPNIRVEIRMKRLRPLL